MESGATAAVLGGSPWARARRGASTVEPTQITAESLRITPSSRRARGTPTVPCPGPHRPRSPRPARTRRPGSSPTADPRRTSESRASAGARSEEHTSELQLRRDLVCRLLLEKKKKNKGTRETRTNLKESRYKN